MPVQYSTTPTGTLVTISDTEIYVVVNGQHHLVADPELLTELRDELSAPTAGARTSLRTDAPSGDDTPTPRGPDLGPVIEATQEDEVPSDRRRRYMWTHARLSPRAGRLDCKTRTWTRQPLIGFTGGVSVFLEDERGEYIYNTELIQFGVDGFRIPFKEDDRTDNWLQMIPPELSVRTRRLVIAHTHSPKNRFEAILREAKERTQQVAEIVQVVREAFGG